MSDEIKYEVRSIIAKLKSEKEAGEKKHKEKLDAIAENILGWVFNERDEIIQKIGKKAIDMAKKGYADPFIFKVSDLQIIKFEEEGNYYLMLEKKADDELFRARFRITKIINLVCKYFCEKEYLKVKIQKKEDGTYLSISFLEDRDVSDLTTYD